ncbi:MAG: response regulator [Myxococcota bacterium]
MLILLVDDDPDILRLCEIALRRDGHDVVTAQRGATAINQSLAREFDLLITDVMLPDINGLELVRAVKAQAPQIPVIVISALQESEVGARALDAGAARFIEKPLRLDELRREVAMAAASRAGLKVLYVDPDPLHRNRVKRTLQLSGCEVNLVDSLQKARGVVEGGFLPTLVLMDSSVPGGEELLAWARSRNVPLFAFSDHTDAEKEDRMMRAGAALFLTKPLDADALLTQARFLGGLAW